MAKTRKTKLPNITQLPSGAYHARVTYTDEDGNRKTLSITDHDYNTVLLRCANAVADRTQNKVDRKQGRSSMTLHEAMERYLDTKSAVLSPSTMRSYRTIVNNYLKPIRDRYIEDITADMIQSAINQEAMTHSPKTVRNIHGYLTAVMQVYRPEFTARTTLPQRKKPTIAIPTEDEVRTLFQAAKGTDAEIPLLLAACCGMRRSEIAALTWRCIDFKKGTISIKTALVKSDTNTLVEKTTKTTAGTRTIRMYPFVAETLLVYKESGGGKDGYLTVRPDIITHRFEKLLKDTGLPHYRFHDLRHYTVSVMLSLNIPKNYIASFVGHASERMVDEVYGHLMASKKTTVEEQMQGYFEGVFGKM